MTVYQTAGVCLATMLAWRLTLNFLVGVARNVHDQFHMEEGESGAIGFRLPQDPEDDGE